MNYTLSIMGRAFNRFSRDQPLPSTTRWKEESLTVNPRHATPVFFLNLNGEISLVYLRYKALNFSLNYSIKYFENNNCFLSILNLFFS